MFRFADGEIFHRTFDHAFDGIAVTIHHPRRKRTVIHADANGTTQAFCFLHKRGESFKNFFAALIKIFVGLQIESCNACIDEITRIDADFFYPLERFECRFRLEMNVCGNGNFATRCADLFHHFLEALSVGESRRSNADEFAASLS